MTVVEFLNYVIEYINLSVRPYAPFSIGSLSSENKALAIRLMPIGRGQEYQSGDRDKLVQFQVLSKSNNQLQALSTLSQIAEKLEEKGIQTYVEPNFIQQDNQAYIYSAAFRAER